MGVMGVEQKAWTYADDALLRELIAAKKTASQIAAVVKRSRNAVIGRAHRLKLSFWRAGMFKPGARRKQSAPKRGVSQKLDTSGVTNQRPASLSGENAGAIQFREANSSRQSGKPSVEPPPSTGGNLSSSRALNGLTSADAGAGEISPFAPLAPVALPVPLMELTARSCRYIVEGEGEYALFCNAPRLEHGPYCPSHAARCYTAPERRRAA